ERAAVAAAEVDLVAVARREATKAVPLRLVEEAIAWKLARKLREHRRQRPRKRQVHAVCLPARRRVARSAGARFPPMVRVRFAPSPTGSLHIGNALSAVANRRLGDWMLLRIDDTDAARNAAGGEDAILRDLKWLA